MSNNHRVLYATADAGEANELEALLKDNNVNFQTIRSEPVANGAKNETPFLQIQISTTDAEKAEAILASFLKHDDDINLIEPTKNETSNSHPAQGPTPQNQSTAKSILLFVAGGILGSAITLLATTQSNSTSSLSPPSVETNELSKEPPTDNLKKQLQPTAPILNGWFEQDSNKDGKTDEWAFYKNDQLEKLHLDENYDGQKDNWSFYKNGLITHSHTDSNFDGKVDEWTYFSISGRITRVETDMNHDGNKDAWENFKNSQFTSGEYDLNYDNKPDEWTFAVHGQVEQRHIALKGNGIIDKKIYYKHGVKQYDELDKNQDGTFEITRYFDRFGKEITKSEFDKSQK